MDNVQEIIEKNTKFFNCVYKNIEDKLKKPIFQKAFTDPSYDNTKKLTNDRLEAIGDRLLDFILFDRLYNQTELNKEEMDNKRQKCLDESGLAKIYDLLKFENLEKHIKHQRGLMINNKVKHRIIEAFFGAIFIDGGAHDGGYEAAYEYWDFLNLNQIIGI